MIDRCHGGDINRKLIDFSANINPLGLSPKAKKAIIENIGGLVRYPEPDARGLKKALADFHGIREDNLAVGNGSIELIHLIPRVLNARKILIITPSFSEYEFAARLSNAKIVFFKTNEYEDFRIDSCSFKRLLPYVDLVFLGNPNNPTASYLCNGELSPLADLCLKHETSLMIDEVFMDFVRTYNEDNLLQLAPKHKSLLILRSLTKFFALPGLRIGYLAANRDLIKKISNFQYPWNINSLAQAAAKEVLKDRLYIDRSKSYVAKEREFLVSGLNNIRGLKVFTPSSNFILCKLEGCDIKNANILNKGLIKKGMVVRSCANFRGLDERFFRLAVRKREENYRLLAALAKIL